MKINEEIFKIIKKVEDKTLTDYNVIWKNEDKIEGYITAEDLLSMVEDLLYEVNYLEEKIEDLEKPKEYDNYDAWQDQQLEAGLL